MSFLQTTLKSGYITDLILPAAREGQSPDDVLRFGVDAIFSSIHNAETMITLNPLVHEVKQLPATDPKAVDCRTLVPSFGVAVDAPYVVGEGDGFRHHEILDKLNLMFGYTTDLTYHAAIRHTQTGMEAFTNAGSGVVIHGRWEVKVSDDQKIINIIERNVIRCNVVLSWYIKASLDKSHRETHRRLKEKWIKDMKEAGYEF